MPALEIVKVDEPDALFCHYPSVNAPQPCQISLNLRDGQLSCDYNPSIDNGRPMDVFHGIVLTADIPCLTADAADTLMNNIADLARTVLAGSDIEWDGNNHVGRLDDAADEAWGEIVAACAEENFSDGDLVVGYTAADWFADDDLVAAFSLTAETTDEQLDTHAAEAVRDASTSSAVDYGYCVLDINDVTSHLTEVRDRLREELREELTSIANEIERLTAKRDATIRRVRAWDADTLREIGELVGLSHTQIARIAPNTADGIRE